MTTPGTISTAAYPGPRRRDPPSPSAGIVSALLLAGLPGVLAGIAAAKGGVGSPWVPPLAAAAVSSTLLVVLMDLRYGLALFIVAAGLSPKLPGFYNNLRVEDFIFVMVFGVWAMRVVQSGRRPRLRSPIVLPFILLTIVSVGASLYGWTLGTVYDPTYSIFLQAKRVEYFLIFLLVTATVRTEPWLRALTLVFIASGALAALYGMATPADAAGQSVVETRVTGPQGENYNTLSGYLVVCIGVGLGAIPGIRGHARLLAIGCCGIATAGLLLTFSREGYVMLAGSLLVFGFTRQRWILVVATLLMVVVLGVSEPVRRNFALTFQTIQKSRDDDPGSNSLTARFRAWEYRWNGWFIKQPLLGNGVGSVGLSVDNEYLLRACEVGVVGLALFVWWLAAIGQQVRQLMNSAGFARYLATGLAAAFVGLLIQGTVAASFTSIRTMEPFWFLLGLVTAAVAIQRTAAEKAVTESPCAS